MEYHCLKRFRRRRRLAFLRRNRLLVIFDALKHETRVFFDVRFLQRLVMDGQWQEAREYISRFLPCRDNQMLVDAHSALRFITHFNVLEDLAQGKLGGYDAAEDLERQIEAIPCTMADNPHYTEAVRTVFDMGSHPAYWDPVDWQIIRLKAAQVVEDLVTRSPEFRHLLQLPQCPSNPCYIIPFGFGGCRRHKRRKMGRMPASLLARRFLQKERRPSSPWTQVSGLSCEPMDLKEIIDETLLAGKQEVREHSDSCSGGIPGSPVGSFIGKSCGISPANAVTKHLNQQCYAESASGAKLKPPIGKFGPIHRERPILSGSASSSSGLNMGDAHLWTHDEEIALFREAHVLLTTRQFSRKSQLNEELARVLNGCFPEVAIKFTSNTIKNKVMTFKSRWTGGRPLLTCNRAQIECSATVARFFFNGTTSGSETTNSGAADSVNVNNGRIPTIQNVNNGRIPTIQECIILAESLEGLTPIEKADASELMRLDPAAREAFMSFNDEQVRLLWIKKLIGPVNNPGTA